MDQSEFRSYIAVEREKINKQIMRLFKDVIAEDDEPFLRKFFESDLDFLMQGGRRLLPITAVTTFIGLSSDRDMAESIENMYRASVSVEMLHIGNLIIDDYLDHEEVRSGNPTFHKFMTSHFADMKEMEISAAIYGGSLTSFLGTKVLTKSHFDEKLINRAVQAYIDGLQGVTRGHLLENYFSNRALKDITLEDYLILAEYKRGKQMETGALIGAILANARESQIRPLKLAMNKIGIIDQITNDIKGTFGDSSLKSVDNDIIQGQRTILSIIAYQNANKQQKETLISTLGNQNASKDSIEKVREIFKSTQAVEFAKSYALTLKMEAINMLKDIYPGLRKDNEDFFIQFMEYLLINV
jgi:geranylgeranyl diphosphate synthase type I